MILFQFMRIFLELFRKAGMSLAAIKPNIVFVLGGPGAGKGTQCEKIVQVFIFLFHNFFF